MNARIVNCVESMGPSGEAAQELAVAGTAVSAAALGERTNAAMVSVKTNDVLCTLDGTAPVTATAVGMLLVKGYFAVWSRRMVAAAKFIEAVGSAAGVVRIEPLRE